MRSACVSGANVCAVSCQKKEVTRGVLHCAFFALLRILAASNGIQYNDPAWFTRPKHFRGQVHSQIDCVLSTSKRELAFAYILQCTLLSAFGQRRSDRWLLPLVGVRSAVKLYHKFAQFSGKNRLRMCHWHRM
jgi:hypothetical protein